MALTIDQIAEAILIAHQRHSIRGCLCGWSELGRSHPGHQVAMLREAGLLDETGEVTEQHRDMLRAAGLLATVQER